MGVHGVLWIDTDDTPPKPHRFGRWGHPPDGELRQGRIPIGPHEVARCLSDPNLPEHGRIDFIVEGGS